KQKVLTHIANRRHRKRARAQYPHQVTFNERNLGAVHGDVSARAHRYADISPGERRRIIYSVACHGDYFT
ncbi:hypothetical protein RT21_22945, partial [Pseudomonas sp. 10B238]